MTRRLVNYHVIDETNIGDLMSSPLRYFDFPGFECQTKDVRELKKESENSLGSLHENIILGGGGLLFERFLPHIQALQRDSSIGRRILWGAGQQLYGKKSSLDFQGFDYQSYTKNFELVGIRDFGIKYDWVPCVSCMHPAFDKVRSPCHPYVIFSHKKFQISLPGVPRMSNEHADMEAILDFLGSGETILTSSFHGAYWGTLLGRKVLAFPFSSKFFTMKHSPKLYSATKWSSHRWKLSVFGRTIYELKYKNKFTCSLEDWQQSSQEAQAYPESLEECRERTQNFYVEVMDAINS